MENDLGRTQSTKWNLVKKMRVKYFDVLEYFREAKEFDKIQSLSKEIQEFLFVYSEMEKWLTLDFTRLPKQIKDCLSEDQLILV